MTQDAWQHRQLATEPQTSAGKGLGPRGRDTGFQGCASQDPRAYMRTPMGDWLTPYQQAPDPDVYSVPTGPPGKASS